MSTNAPYGQPHGIYAGERTIDGVVVTFDGVALSELVLPEHRLEGSFEWGYEGDSPTYLAYALLLHHTGDPAAADAMAPGLMKRLVARLADEWEIGHEELDELVQTLQVSPPAGR